MNIKQAERKLTQALDDYAITLSDDDRRKARAALWAYLKAGGRVAVQQWAQEKSA